jgi:tight adherence protein B
MRGPLLVGLGAALVIRYPWLAGLLALAVMVRSIRHRSRRRESKLEAGLDLIVTARILLVALAAGLPLPAAIALAAEKSGSQVREELERVLRLARRVGTAAALASCQGAITRPLLSRLALAQASGAPMSESVAAFLAETQAARRTEALERVRRLPVTLMIPLGLLILPGFVVLFAGPIVVGSLFDLLGALP